MRSSHNRGPFGRIIANGLITVAAAALLAGCSNSIERFSANYDNPSDADPVYTASVPKVAKPVKKQSFKVPSVNTAQVDDSIVESPVSRAPLPVKQKTYDYAQAYQPAYKQPSYGAAKPKIAYNKPKLTVDDSQVFDDQQQAANDVPAAEKPYVRKKVAAIAAAPAQGSQTVTVADNMTMYSIARDNGVSVQELAAANNLKAPYSLMVGQKLRIPSAGLAETAETAYVPKKRVQQVAVADESNSAVEEPVVKKAGAMHTVASGETLYSLGRKYGVSPFVIADANGLSRDHALSVGQKIKIPGAKKSVAAVDDNVADAGTAAVPAPSKNKKKAPLSLAEEEQQSADASANTADDGSSDATAAAEPAKKQVTTDAPVDVAGLSLRWPVKGKVISGFGSKPNGLKNEGINIAVPEGTGVRAAEGGVVAYAGNELKGYGNLVLIRHTGGYVTAYAHAKELFVKRGDKVNRGDVIAKAGQTGAVSSPQLHFEVRKGATALDPMKYMTSATASN